MEKKNYLGELVFYIKKNLKKGYTKESLKWALISQGHSRLEIERAFNGAEKELSKEAPVLKTKPKITHEIIEPKTNTVIEPPKKSFLEKLFS